MSFEVVPAIDLRDGRCVRLVQGDYDRETSYSDDPLSVARTWQAAGAPRLHLVDLDGARAGAPANAEIMAKIRSALKIPVEVSGGFRTVEAIDRAVAYGAGRVQLGSVAVRAPEVVREGVQRHGEAIVVSIDARDGEVRTDGWERRSGIGGLELAKQMVDAGVARLMVTDIGRDGAMQGPNVEMMATFARELPIPVVASGGCHSVNHIRALAETGCEGVVIGKALYEGDLDLRQALEVAATC